jgi:hypothetical protein
MDDGYTIQHIRVTGRRYKNTIVSLYKLLNDFYVLFLTLAQKMRLLWLINK